MKKLLNVLYVSSPQSYLARDGESIVVRGEKEVIGRVPIHNLESVICFGFMGASPELMELCTSRNVSVSFVSPYGRFLGRVSGRISGNVLLRRRQYAIADDPITSGLIAKNCVLGKLMNCRSVLMRFTRDHTKSTHCEWKYPQNSPDASHRKKRYFQWRRETHLLQQSIFEPPHQCSQG